jgi:hypothetical protein
VSTIITFISIWKHRRPCTGLEASTRAYARIIDDVNKLPLSTFQRPKITDAGDPPAAGRR